MGATRYRQIARKPRISAASRRSACLTCVPGPAPHLSVTGEIHAAVTVKQRIFQLAAASGCIARGRDPENELRQTDRKRFSDRSQRTTGRTHPDDDTFTSDSRRPARLSSRRPVRLEAAVLHRGTSRGTLPCTAPGRRPMKRSGVRKFVFGLAVMSFASATIAFGVFLWAAMSFGVGHVATREPVRDHPLSCLLRRRSVLREPAAAPGEHRPARRSGGRGAACRPRGRVVIQAVSLQQG